MFVFSESSVFAVEIFRLFLRLWHDEKISLGLKRARLTVILADNSQTHSKRCARLAVSNTPHCPAVSVCTFHKTIVTSVINFPKVIHSESITEQRERERETKKALKNFNFPKVIHFESITELRERDREKKEKSIQKFLLSRVIHSESITGLR